jgi:hypothetical protein
MYKRVIGWTMLCACGLFRPGVDRADRWLVSTCWTVPSQWNAVADAAIRTGAVDGTIRGAAAPWRQASIEMIGSTKVAVVTVSDMKRSRVTFLGERYESLGGFERVAAEPTLITDEARGYKPLSHVWPLVFRDGRLHTLVAFAHLVSEEPNIGLFAYAALGPVENELLFVSQLSWGPGPTWGVLSRMDVNGDGIEDFVLYPKGRRDQSPLATFTWDPRDRTYVPSVTSDGRGLISWWSTAPGSRVTFPRNAVLDDAVRRVVPTPAHSGA